jgi:modification methylase
MTQVIENSKDRNEVLASQLDRIILGDCVECLKDIPDAFIDSVITDPPYGIAKKKPLTGNSHGSVKTLDVSWDLFGSQEEFVSFTNSWLIECHRILKPNGTIAVWGDRRNIFFVQPLLEELFPKFLDLLTWVKRDAPPNITQRGLAASTEFCLIYCKAETGWTFNGQEIKKYNGGKQARKYLDIQRSMGAAERLGHPTQKKIETQQFLVEMLSNPGEIVVDPFVGSGTTAAACLATDRRFLAIERDPHFHEIASKRVMK